jgi:hypothetical protein
MNRSEKKHTHIEIEECGYVHFNNAIGFVEKKIWRELDTRIVKE